MRFDSATSISEKLNAGSTPALCPTNKGGVMSLKDKYAYPTHAAGVNNLGMTYREWLVGMALAGGETGIDMDGTPYAIKRADAIIAALEKNDD